MLKQLREKRAQLVREAEGLKGADGTFATDEARAAFDAKMAEIERIDGQITAAEAVEREAQAAQVRVTDITTAVRTARLPQAFADELIASGKPIDECRAAIFAKMAEEQAKTPTRNQVITFGDDERDAWMRRGEAWLLQRSGYATSVAKHAGTAGKPLDPGEFRGMTLLDLAREVCERAGITTRGMDPLKIAGAAMSLRGEGPFQTTSDFAVLLENTLNKVLQAAYALQPDTWSQMCFVGSASDFRSQNWYRTGFLSVYDDISEVGEFKNKALPDGEKASFSVKTKGNIIGISRETVVNDDLGSIARLMDQLGRAGKLTIEKMFYALLLQNAGLGPTMTDTNTLFHANHANIATQTALSAAGLEVDRTFLGQQQDVNKQEYLVMTPAVLLVPISLGGTARVINNSQYDPDATANKAINRPNVAYQMLRSIVDTPRITANRRYMFADPQVSPVFVASFLNGQQEPQIDTQDGWRFNGVEMRARLDVGMDVVDYRGAVTNAG